MPILPTMYSIQLQFNSLFVDLTYDVVNMKLTIREYNRITFRGCKFHCFGNCFLAELHKVSIPALIYPGEFVKKPYCASEVRSFRRAL